MHEAAHRTLLRDRRWNDWVGNWLCALSGLERPRRRTARITSSTTRAPARARIRTSG